MGLPLLKSQNMQAGEKSFSSSNTAHGSILFSRKQLALVVRGHIHLLVGHVFQEHKIE
jgi:hypothetical protein